MAQRTSCRVGLLKHIYEPNRSEERSQHRLNVTRSGHYCDEIPSTDAKHWDGWPVANI